MPHPAAHLLDAPLDHLARLSDDEANDLTRLLDSAATTQDVPPHRVARARAGLALRVGDPGATARWLMDVWRPGRPVGPALSMLLEDGLETVAHAIARDAWSDPTCPDRHAAAAVMRQVTDQRRRTLGLPSTLTA
ncbi:MAG: hypothetical protein H6704_03295 [Myxococcales bacterium]|nr:hypothetical protein [Myxococcales bacterium]